MPGFLVDENLPANLVAELTSRGFPSRHVSDIPELRATSDEEIVQFAERQGLVVLTKDKELSFVTRISGVPASGVVCARVTDRLPIDEHVRVIEPGGFQTGAPGKWIGFMRAYRLDHLSDAALLRDLADRIARDSSSTAELLACIAEVDARRLYRAAGFTSMHACVEDLHLSDDAAYKRIHAAREFPVLFGAVAEGRLY